MASSVDELVDAIMNRMRREILSSTLKATIATWLSAEVVDAELSTIQIDKQTHRFVPKATSETFIGGDQIMVLYSGGIPQTILGKQRGDTHLA